MCCCWTTRRCWPTIRTPIIPSGRIAWLFATLVSWVALAMAAALLMEVNANGALDYEMGGWAAPWGIEYRIDTVNAFVLLIVAAIGARMGDTILAANAVLLNFQMFSAYALDGFANAA